MIEWGWGFVAFEEIEKAHSVWFVLRKMLVRRVDFGSPEFACRCLVICSRQYGKLYRSRRRVAGRLDLSLYYRFNVTATFWNVELEGHSTLLM